MQVILTEDEYLRLKCYHDANNDALVKKIDITIGLEEFFKTLEPHLQLHRFNSELHNETQDLLNKAVERFWNAVERKKEI